MAPLHPSETLATGMVRPKTTALFFDRLWVHPAFIKGFDPEDELEPYRVPPDLCILHPQHILDYYEHAERQRVYAISRWKGYDDKIDVTERLRRLNLQTWYMRDIFEIDALQHFGVQDPSLRRQWEELRDRILPQPNWFWQENAAELYVTTYQRNKAIALISRLYASRGTALTPIYLTSSEFDEEIPEENGEIGLEACLDQIPTVVDSQLSWEHVLEFRKDNESKEMLNRLRRWFTLDLVNKSAAEIRTTLEKRLEDYEYALRKHGIQTAVAATTSVLSFVAAPTALQLSTSSYLAAVAGGVTLLSGAVAWVANKIIERSDLKRTEVAYIYDVRKKLTTSE